MDGLFEGIKNFTNYNLGTWLLIAAVCAGGVFMLNLMVGAFNQMANSFSRIAEAADRAVRGLTNFLVVSFLIAIFIYGMYLTSGKTGFTAAKEGRSYKVEISK